MRQKDVSTSKPEVSVIDGALAAMGAEELRKLILDILPWLDDKTFARLTNELIDRAARGEAAWTPPGPTDESISEVLTFAEAAKRIGYADPSDVDDYLRQGINAFLGKNYSVASQIFRALLIPISECDFDLGQHEMVDEVLGVDVRDCAAQYVVAMYMTSVPAHRATAVRSAIGEMSGEGHFWEPLREMERVAVEPLPDFDEFLPQWRVLVEESAGRERCNDWDTDEDRWRREVVQRLEGANGLAAIARSTGRSDDLQAWCSTLVEAGDWKAALTAHEEAAEIVTDKTYSQGSFLDGAALAAQELGRKDLPSRLEQAWRKAPSVLRLGRWLDSAGSNTVMKKRSTAALNVCPKQAHRQRALLHILLEDFKSAAKLLASAPGLGWSQSEHPGHLLFPVFCRLLSDGAWRFEQDARSLGVHGMDIDALESLSTVRDEPRLSAPSADELIEKAGIGAVTNDTERAAVIGAMRTAAEKRIDGVTENKRRRYYGHATSLAVACVAVDPTPKTTEWMTAIRIEYRRYPALQREFEWHERAGS